MTEGDATGLAGEGVDPGASAAEVGGTTEGPTARRVVEFITKSLTDAPDDVVIDADGREGSIRFRVRAAGGDMGRLIGRRGRVAQAIRTVVRVAGAQDGVETHVDFVDD